MADADNYLRGDARMDEDYEEIVPVDKMDDLCGLLTGMEYEIHRHDEEEYSYLKGDDVCITVINPYDKRKMYIDLEEEFTITFDAYHAHYEPDAFGYKLLVEFIEQLINNEVCLASLYCGKDREWLGSTTYGRDEIQNPSIRQLFAHIYKIREFKDRLDAGGGTAEFIFWDPQYNVIKTME